MPSAAAREVMTAPPTLARDLLKATVTASTRSRTPACSDRAPAALAEHAEAVGLVDDQPRAVAGAEVGDLGQRRQLAGHRVDAVDDHDRAGPRVEPAQPLREAVEVVVPEADRRAPAGRRGRRAGWRATWASTSRTSPGPQTWTAARRWR